MGQGFFIYSRTPSAVLELLVPCHLPLRVGLLTLWNNSSEALGYTRIPTRAPLVTKHLTGGGGTDPGSVAGLHHYI